MTIKFLLWSVPVLIWPVSWLFYTFAPFRAFRYWLYAIILVAAFTLDLYRITFTSILFDATLTMVVNFILIEYFWNLRRVAKGRFFTVLFIMAIAGFGWFHWKWIGAGPGNGLKLWKPEIASTYTREGVLYRVVDKDLFDRIHPAREIILTKRCASVPMEKLIKSYRTPEGYSRTPFTYTWSRTSVGVRLDMYDGTQMHRTLGEEF